MLAARSSRALRATALPCKTACRAFSATVLRPGASVAAEQKQKQPGGDHHRISKRSASAISINHLQVNQSPFASLDEYTPRHVGPREHEVQDMLSTLGFSSMEDFVDKVVPSDIRIGKNSVSDEALAPLSENELVRRAAEIAGQNVKAKNFIGMGYHEAVVPPVIMRNVCSMLRYMRPSGFLLTGLLARRCRFLKTPDGTPGVSVLLSFYSTVC